MNVPGAGPGKNGELLFREDRVACGENEKSSGDGWCDGGSAMQVLDITKQYASKHLKWSHVMCILPHSKTV